jgi:hypothetical protein
VCQGCTRVMSLYSHLCIKQKSSIENFFFLKSLYRGLLRNSCIYSDFFFVCVRGARQMSEWTQRAGHQDVGAIQVNDK